MPSSKVAFGSAFSPALSPVSYSIFLLIFWTAMAAFAAVSRALVHRNSPAATAGLCPLSNKGTGLSEKQTFPVPSILEFQPISRPYIRILFGLILLPNDFAGFNVNRTEGVVVFVESIQPANPADQRKSSPSASDRRKASTSVTRHASTQTGSKDVARSAKERKS